LTILHRYIKTKDFLSFGKVLLTDLHFYRQRCAAVMELSANEGWLLLCILLVEIKY